MAKLKINGEVVKQAVKNAGNVLAFTALMIAPYVSVRDIIKKIRYMRDVTYDDTISEILHSNMWTADKVSIVTSLPKNMNTEFYKSIIAVIESNLYSSDKVRVIEDMCEKFNPEKGES